MPFNDHVMFAFQGSRDSNANSASRNNSPGGDGSGENFIQDINNSAGGDGSYSEGDEPPNKRSKV